MTTVTNLVEYRRALAFACKTIPPGSRCKIHLRGEFATAAHEWDLLEEVQMDSRLGAVPANIFATLRQVDRDDPSSEYYVDIYRF